MSMRILATPFPATSAVIIKALLLGGKDSVSSTAPKIMWGVYLHSCSFNNPLSNMPPSFPPGSFFSFGMPSHVSHHPTPLSRDLYFCSRLYLAVVLVGLLGYCSVQVPSNYWHGPTILSHLEGAGIRPWSVRNHCGIGRILPPQETS